MWWAMWHVFFMQISWSIQQWKNFENRPTFVKVMNERIAAQFFLTHCVCYYYYYYYYSWLLILWWLWNLQQPLLLLLLLLLQLLLLPLPLILVLFSHMLQLLPVSLYNLSRETFVDCWITMNTVWDILCAGQLALPKLDIVFLYIQLLGTC